MNKNTKKIIFLFFLTLTSFFITGCNGAFQYGFFKSIGALVVALVPMFVATGYCLANNERESSLTFWSGLSIACAGILFLMPFFYSPTDGFWFRCVIDALLAIIFVNTLNPLTESIDSDTRMLGLFPFLLTWGYSTTILFVPFFVESFWFKVIGYVVLAIILGIYSGIFKNKILDSEAGLRKARNERMAEQVAKEREFEEQQRKFEAKKREQEKKEAEREKELEKLKPNSSNSDSDLIFNIVSSEIMGELDAFDFTTKSNWGFRIDNDENFCRLMKFVKETFEKLPEEKIDKARCYFESDDNISFESLKNPKNLENAWKSGSLRIKMEDETQIITAERKANIRGNLDKGNCLNLIYKNKKDDSLSFTFNFYHSNGLGQIAITNGNHFERMGIDVDSSIDPTLWDLIMTVSASRLPHLSDVSMELVVVVGAIFNNCYKNLNNGKKINLQKSTISENIPQNSSKSQKLPTDHLHILHLLGEKEYDMTGYDDVNMSNSEITGCESDAEYEIFKRAIENFDSLFNADPRKSYTNVRFEIEDTYDQFSEYEKNLMIVTALQNKAELRKIWDSGKLLLCAGNKEQGSGLVIKGLGAGGIKITFHAENLLWDLEYRCSPGNGHLKFMLAYNMNGEQAEIKISTKKSKLLTFPIFLRILKYENMIKPFQVTMSLLFGMALI